MRSAFITNSGDPFILLHTLSYLPVWREEVDEVWVVINSTMERSVILELIRRLPKDVKFIYLNQRMGYGKPINLLLESSPGGNVLLLEDDSIIFKKGIVDQYFKMIEEGKYDLIGSPRMSCTPEVAEKLRQEFNLNYEGYGDKGPNFWPCFLWTKKELLLQTDRCFDPTKWGDTFCWTSVQLRRLTNKILEIPQYHCSPNDFENHSHNRGIFDGNCGYMHLGSLSSGIESYLLDENQTPLMDREAGIPALNPKPIENTPEMQRRLMWWVYCFIKGAGDFRDLEFINVYEDALNRIAKSFDSQDVIKWEKLYWEVIGAELSRSVA